MAEGQGRKDDTGKLRFDLIPVAPLRKVAEVYTIGAKKYADRNWEKGIQWGRIFAAMQRHSWSWWNGEEKDPVDGQHHLASVAWCALALMEYERTHRELDDRPSSGTITVTKDDPELVRPTVPRDAYCLGSEVQPVGDDSRTQNTSFQVKGSDTLPLFHWNEDFGDRG